MSELLPCPFCGGEADEYEGEYGNGIYCMQCGAMVGEPIHLGFNVAERVSYGQAIEAWNTRADTATLYEDGFYLHGRKFVPERTCRNTDDDCDAWFECSECGLHSKLEIMSGGYGIPNYCPNCGARVTPKNSETTPKVVS